jgi:nucleotide-binding universal stress UspA family protein
MAIKNILLHLTNDPRNELRINSAIALAQVHNAHITALYVIAPPQVPAYVMAYIPPDVLEKQAADAAKLADEVKAKFSSQCEREGVPFEWRQAEGDPRSVSAFHAHYADLVVVGQTAPAEERAEGTEELADELVLTSGRPVLVVPYAGKFNEFGRTVLVAWNSTRESTRAVHDAMPILQKADKVIIYAINESSSDHIPGADIAAHLASHGVNAEAHHTVARDISVGDALLAAVSDYGADLLVMGAYGHSRFRELTLGGATRTILETMTAPVMMSH